MSKPAPARYRTTNWKSYNEALKRRGSLLIWLDKDMEWHAPKAGRPGRPPVFSDAVIQFCLMVKVLFGLPLRQTTGMVSSILQMAGLDWPVPDFSTLSRRQKTITVGISSRRAPGPLNLLVDSTGIKFLGDGEWLARKHGTHRRRQYRKVHLAMDTGSGDILAAEFTSSREGDSPVLPDLLDQIPPDQEIGTVKGDGAFDTRRCHTAILARGGTAIIPIRKNGRFWKENCPAALARNDILRATRLLGRAIWKKWSGYHARSRIRIALMNRFNALGQAEDRARGLRLSGKGGSSSPRRLLQQCPGCRTKLPSMQTRDGNLRRSPSGRIGRLAIAYINFSYCQTAQSHSG